MSIVSPKEISSIRQIERLVKQKFHRSDIPDGAEVVRKRLFFYLEQIANTIPQEDFAKLYQSSIHERFEDMDKDELIRRLVWLQLRDTIDMYQDAEDLNAGYDNSGKGNREVKHGRSVRLFINLGQKDGMNNERLVQFVAEMTDMDGNIFDRVTVRDLSSFINVPTSAAELIIQSLSSKKFKGRKVKVEEAEQPRFGGTSGSPSTRSGDSRNKYSKQGERKFNKRY
jgi:ATP-dependent RNA helicase DeaD